MAVSKKEAKPMYVPQKDDVVLVDRTVLRSAAWQYFGMHKKALCSSWVVVLQMGSRHGNINTTNMKVYHLKTANGIKLSEGKE